MSALFALERYERTRAAVNIAFGAQLMIALKGSRRNDMDWLSALPVKEILAALVSFLSMAYAFLEKNKDKVQGIVLRIEKERADGWTNVEKENLAVELFFTEVLPYAPWYLKILPRPLLEGQVRKVIRAICAEASKVAGRVKKKTTE